ncbi:MAG: outer membrane protein assembly factor BamE [Proteobacteria bacterium]|nr:outer membrane protein assembly factor BamE [Pseudomonadota bacterium]
MRFKIILLSLLLASCGSMPSSLPAPSPYKMDIRQGNFVTAEMRDKIKPGMSRAQVRYALGTPMIMDVFHANRWDYVYRLEHDRKLVDQQRLTLYFEGDSLVRIDDSALTVKPVANEVK